MKGRFAWMMMIAMVPVSLLAASHNPSATFRSTRAAKDTPPDTDPQSQFWKGAGEVSITRGPLGNPVPLPATRVYSRWTHDYLYFLFVCPYHTLYLNPHPHPAVETFALWNWDVAEVFIGSDFKDIQRYKEFEISPLGEWVDLDVNLHLPNHEVGWRWNSGFRVAARIDREKKVWYGWMKIPFRALGPLPAKEGTVFRVNLYRQQGPPPAQVQLAWQPTGVPQFHVPERFGRLHLVSSQ
jgi:hypothetical protein